MNRTPHRAIAEKIGAELKLPKNNLSLLIEGSLGPDSHGDFPHHTGKYRKIFESLEKQQPLTQTP